MKTFLEPERPTPPYSSDSKTSASPGLSTTWVLHKIWPYVAIAKPDYWFQNVFMGVTDPREFDHAFSTISGKVTAALYIQAGSLTLSHRSQIVDLVAKARLREMGVINGEALSCVEFDAEQCRNLF